jgi:hypothetical protein
MGLKEGLPCYFAVVFDVGFLQVGNAADTCAYEGFGVLGRGGMSFASMVVLLFCLCISRLGLLNFLLGFWCPPFCGGKSVIGGHDEILGVSWVVV